MALASPRLLARVQFIPRIAAFVAILAGAEELVGWRPGESAIHFSAGMGFILAGTSLLLFHSAEVAGRKSGAAKILGSLVLLSGLLTLFRDLFEMIAIPQAAYIAPISAVCFSLFGIASVTFSARERQTPSSPLSAIVGVIAFFSLVGFRLGLNTDMTVPASIAFLSLSIGMLLLRLDPDLLLILLSGGPGGIIAQLDREREQLRLKNEFREQFVSMLSHDLRSPLTAAKASAQLILRTIARSGGRSPGELAKLQKLCNQISTTIARADDLIQDLLDANRIQAGHPLPVKFKSCELRTFLRTLLDEFSLVHGNRFRLLLPEGDCTGYWDESALRRALENLAQNAVKYGVEGAPITLRLDCSEKEVQIVVHNEGNPIPPELQKTIFEPFSRSPHVLRSGKKGWGIGLVLVRAVAQAHFGSVTVESSPGYGTFFTLTLPRDPRAFAPAEPTQQVAS